MNARRWLIASLLIACLVAFGGCIGYAGGTSSPAQILATFTGSGDGQTAQFNTTGPWVLAWSCSPTIDGASSPYDLTIHVFTPEHHFIGTGILDIQCTTYDYQGTVGVRVTGDQWLNIGTGGVDGPWTLQVEL
jgi:hypothetical protein